MNTTLKGALVAAALIASTAGSVSAQLGQRFRHEGQIGYTTVAGSLRAAANGSNACSLNGSSTAVLSGIPAGATITAAYLYWSGSGNTDNTVTFRGSSVSADETWSDTYTQNNTTYRFFGARADVTSRITGNASLSFTGLTVSTSNTYCQSEAVLAAWAVVVVYQHASEPIRRVEVWDGFDLVRETTRSFTLSEFLSAPASDAQLSMLTWEGDATIVDNEQVTFNGASLVGAGNTAGDIFNSSSGYGVDFDTWSVSSNLAPGSRSATVGYSTGTDLLAVQAAITSMSIVTVDVTPKGVPATTNRTLGTSYSELFVVENSSLASDEFDMFARRTGSPLFLQIDSVTGPGLPGGGLLSDSMRVSIPAQATRSYAVWYTVPAGPVATNVLRLTARSVTYPTRPEAESEGFLGIQRTLAPDLTVTKAVAAAMVQGANATYGITIRNIGSASTSGTITVRDALPAGLSFVSAAAVVGSWTISASGQVVTATRSATLPVNDSATFNLVVAVGAAAVPAVTNTAVVNGGGQLNLANDTAFLTTAVQGVIDIALTKTGGASVPYGGTGDYTITVSNPGSMASVGAIVVTDTLPAGVTFVDAVGADWTFTSMAAGGRDIVVGTYAAPVAAAGSAAFTLTGRFLGSGSVTNRAWVTGGGDENPSNNSDSQARNITTRPDLSIVKTSTAGFTQGSNGSYTITVTNTGTAITAATITVRDTLPAGITWVSGSGSGWTVSGSAATGVVTATRSNTSANRLSPGQSASFTLIVSVGAAAVPAVTNKAVVSGGNQLNLANDTAFVTTPVAGIVDLTIEKSTAGLGRNAPGTYAINVTNVGTLPTTGTITVRDTLPNEVDYTSAVGDGWSFTTAAAGGRDIVIGTYTGSLAPGGTAGFVIDVDVETPNNPVVNRAWVSGGGDANASNNMATVSGNSVNRPDMTITKTSSSPFRVGDNETYTIRVRNVGAANSIGATTVVDTLPAGVTYISRSGSNWVVSYNATTRVVTAVHGGGINAGANSQYLTLTVAVGADAYPSVTNTARVSGGGDVSAADNSATVTTAVNAPDLMVTKAAPAQFTAGQQGTYTIVVRNIGQIASSGTVTVRDTLPAGAAFVSSANVRGTWAVAHAAGVVTATRSAALAAGDSAIFTIVTLISAHGPTLTNRVSLSGGSQVDASNDTASVTTQIIAPDLTITKVATGVFQLGQSASYTITVSNAGSGATTAAIIVRDTLPAGLTYVSAAGAGWTFARVANVVTASHAAIGLAAGASRAFTLTVQVDSAAVPTTTNRAWVEGGGEFNTSNNGSGDVVTAVSGSPDIVVTIAVTPNGVQAPGTDLLFEIAFLNTGTQPAHDVIATSALSSEVAFKLGSIVSALPTGIAAVVEHESGTTWGYTPVSGGCGAPADYDACVTKVRWVLQTPLAPGANASGWYTARVK